MGSMSVGTDLLVTSGGAPTISWRGSGPHRLSAGVQEQGQHVHRNYATAAMIAAASQEWVRHAALVTVGEDPATFPG
jgi:hypothetical protein